MLPIYILRYIYGGAFAFNEDIAITYVDYLDMVARWDTGIDATPPALLDYTNVETLLTDAYTVYQDAYTLVNGYFETLIYAQKIGSINGSIISQLVDAIQKEQTLHYLDKEEDQFLYSITVDGESTFVLNAAYFTGFTNYTDLVTLFNLYDYEQLVKYGYEWLYTVGQFLGEVFTIEDARVMINDVYEGEIKDLAYPLPDVDFVSNLVIDTYANIAALATGGLLNLSYTYQINDNTDAEGGDIVLKPISTTQFSPYAIYIPNYDSTLLWNCLYNFSLAEIFELQDHRENVVKGNGAINDFIWTSSTILNNLVDNPLSLTLTSVNILDGNYFGKDSTITIVSDGTISNNHIGDNCSFSVNDTGNSTISNNVVNGNSSLVVNSGDTGTYSANHVCGQSLLDIDDSFGGNITNNFIDSSSRIRVDNPTEASNIRYNTVISDSDFLIDDSPATIHRNKIVFSTVTVDTLDNTGGTSSFSGNTFDAAGVSNVLTCSALTIDNNNVIKNGVLSVNTSTGAASVSENFINQSSTLNLVNLDTGAEFDKNNIVSESIVSCTTLSAGQFLRNSVSEESDVTLTNHDGVMQNNRFAAESTITGGADAGVNHDNCIVANSAHAFVAAVPEVGTRVND